LQEYENNYLEDQEVCCDENTPCVPNENDKLNSKIKEELEKNYREQQILLKDNKNAIIDFITDNKDSIRLEDLKIYEPVYKCYREKGNCQVCNRLSNISCKNYNSHHNNKEVGLCTNQWKQHL
jgi:ubiquinone biosynthesis protein COQ9